jgi:chloramphenicol 3-O phosphotransferase
MLIVLTGTSSSGKTTLAQAIKAATQYPILHFEADQIVPALGFTSAPNDAYRDTFFLSLHEAIAAFGQHGLDVLVDGSLPNEPSLRDECLRILRRVPGTKVIAVRCSVEELRRREAKRPDRPLGWAEEQALSLYENQEFDAEVDTSILAADEAARQIIQVAFGT